MGSYLLNTKCRQCCALIYNLRNIQKNDFSNNVIKKLLIANRGEIACRVAKTARKLGIKVVAVYSDADANALHVSMADEAYHIGAAASSESYLRGEKLLGVARRAGCQAIHPGYGFLSENAEFADSCRQAGVIFVGPPASAIRDMGCKSTSKKIMEKAGVPVIKGYHGDDQSDKVLKQEAGKIGYPVMLKALKGGGGKGMRVVLKESDFDTQLASARNEAEKAFGDTAMLVEKFVLHPRHVEVQVFGDSHGNYVHLHERDCSVQRRHQKVIEEAPAPGLSAEVRRGLGATAVKAAQAVQYVGAGTVEFIMDANTFQHYFMEMNTRLQVEHPVTEMITNTDLVEWQLRVASGESLPLTQDDIKATGHAFEARIYAEDPDQGFLPQAGTLHHLKLPASSACVRVDTGVRARDSVPVYYDPLIAKLVVWGEDRGRALQRLRESLADFHISGVPTNINFLLALANHSEFDSANVHTNFITEHGDKLLETARPDRRVVATAVAAQLFNEVRVANAGDTFQANPGFRVNHNLERTLEFIWKGESIRVKLEYLDSQKKKISYSLNGEDVELILSSQCSVAEDDVSIETVIDGHVERVQAVVGDNSVQVFTGQGVVTFDIPPPKWIKLQEGDTNEGETNQKAASPMPGVVDQVLVKVGDKVDKNQPLVTVIAMKMEYVVRAPADGLISEIVHKPGDAVSKGAVLVTFDHSSEQVSQAQNN